MDGAIGSSLLSIRADPEPVDMAQHHREQIKFHEEQHAQVKAKYDQLPKLPPPGPIKDRKDDLRDTMIYHKTEMEDHKDLLKNLGKREVHDLA